MIVTNDSQRHTIWEKIKSRREIEIHTWLVEENFHETRKFVLNMEFNYLFLHLLDINLIWKQSWILIWWRRESFIPKLQYFLGLKYIGKANNRFTIPTSSKEKEFDELLYTVFWSLVMVREPVASATRSITLIVEKSAIHSIDKWN